MTLHENKELYNDAILATAQQKGIKEIYVEKDYWVTLALNRIFTSDIGKEAVFKGGTALSKCYNIIERFSEDIDMVILRNEAETGNQLKTKIKKISNVVAEILPEIEVEGITNKMGMIRKTAHSYTKTFEGQFGQVRDIIIVESTWLGSFEPYTNATVTSFVTEMMKENNQEELINQYHLNPFDVLVLSLERTLCEKIMSLMRFSFTEDPITDLNNKIRHIYDIHKLLEKEEINAFFQSSEFDNLLLIVANDDVISFKNNNGWLDNHPATAMIYADIENTWNQLRTTYNTTFNELVYGELPTEEQILTTLNTVKERLKKVDWKVDRETSA
ncbi:nucleotidyl transferase AbiEii/AbiGii toxin family protein [Flavobacterium macrobrachii]|uniref:Nucleotidyl transferase AbiEii/AbiGii toxin family protein n=1 Tax=Flavobacterium macrobrachii TaxID=591204 RepID=A0ABS2CTJ4_9FLAO|nr:nucleotidyl transferase AbiEii/AbiGii toxin family protein [Flavobacterium macrobrachii]MBM6498288.1 nucleotidyl transferase AbiEii/AbiGii toxin family protein [Flavobacterium macrobrachii]